MPSARSSSATWTSPRPTSRTACTTPGATSPTRSGRRRSRSARSRSRTPPAAVLIYLCNDRERARDVTLDFRGRTLRRRVEAGPDARNPARRSGAHRRDADARAARGGGSAFEPAAPCRQAAVRDSPLLLVAGAVVLLVSILIGQKLGDRVLLQTERRIPIAGSAHDPGARGGPLRPRRARATGSACRSSRSPPTRPFPTRGSPAPPAHRRPRRPAPRDPDPRATRPPPRSSTRRRRCRCRWSRTSPESRNRTADPSPEERANPPVGGSDAARRSVERGSPCVPIVRIEARDTSRTMENDERTGERNRTVKRGLAQMLKGGVIMDVVTPEQAEDRRGGGRGGGDGARAHPGRHPGRRRRRADEPSGADRADHGGGDHPGDGQGPHRSLRRGPAATGAGRRLHRRVRSADAGRRPVPSRQARRTRCRSCAVRAIWAKRCGASPKARR